MFSIGNAATLGNWMVSAAGPPPASDRPDRKRHGLVPFAIEALEHQFDEMLAASGIS